MGSAAKMFSGRHGVTHEKVSPSPKPMAHYVPPDKEWLIRVRSTQAFREQVEAAVEIWKTHAEARGDDPDQIDMSYFIRRQLEGGVAQAFEGVGGYPKTKEALEAVKDSIRKSVKKQR